MHFSWKAKGSGRVAQAVAVLAGVLLSISAIACGGTRAGSDAVASDVPLAQPAPPPSQTGGFNGARAWSYLVKIVDFGPRPPGSANIQREQRYLASELNSFGCKVSQDHFQAETGIGLLHMDNIIAKIPGKSPGIILLLTHYDTLRLPGFVGADDGGSSTAMMLEMAHDLCGHPGPLAVWIAFLDGEEDQTNFTTAQQAQTVWSDSNALFGSRELAAKMELSGKLKQVKAVMLADMIGDSHLRIDKDSNSTPWLVNLVWGVADHLGYSKYFLTKSMAVDDDHIPFLKKGVSAIDVIDFNYPWWHTVQDTLNKCSPHSLAVVGHVFLESIKALDKKFAPRAPAKT
jgi:hypothetical protein